MHSLIATILLDIIVPKTSEQTVYFLAAFNGRTIDLVTKKTEAPGILSIATACVRHNTSFSRRRTIFGGWFTFLYYSYDIWVFLPDIEEVSGCAFDASRLAVEVFQRRWGSTGHAHGKSV
ncbi:hypothetical protein D9757_014911 [Collybiopsis confluens]|uniref:Uncharacterized protein n=1 Tax=Collybiopsis confluens TaxID=2823264 RepID=A0A8H5CAS4_9AGAR|nr:hypothetical protein D9757_014911 [Collybiopsis confluens]